MTSSTYKIITVTDAGRTIVLGRPKTLAGAMKSLERNAERWDDTYAGGNGMDIVRAADGTVADMDRLSRSWRMAPYSCLKGTALESMLVKHAFGMGVK